jgi:hypothetical protein
MAFYGAGLVVKAIKEIEAWRDAAAFPPDPDQDYVDAYDAVLDLLRDLLETDGGLEEAA